ncbi:MAG: GspE/PulE family protein [Candidatus Nomurabacteria bacterium]|jgi:type II secretory ATPase GspE/PulE/Tfp pilus assembly ATPase PilB-like protein|nr:GspE/PulE family protein [Candidatus Nomurabacteria bacterium]
MNEEEVQKKRRDNEEQATEHRAQILGLPYLDTRSFENEMNLVPHFEDMVTVKDMRKDFLIPLARGEGESHYQFLATSSTPQSVIVNLRKRYRDDGETADIFLVSNSSYKVFVNRYDPPKETIYDDIKIAGEGDSETLAAVSQTLNSVATEKVFDYLIDQADKLKASDIHIENLRNVIRVRLRVDGILHPVAELSRDRYRILMGELSSRADLSMAATKPQSGHIQKEISVGGATHLLNIRIETVPTMFGQDAVMRLFNFDESLLNIDLLGISEAEKNNLREVISHPRGLVLMVGPTGSGKSTTLYSILNALNTTDRKIITLEDPIEYSITGIAQVPIHTNDGGSFADGLRSVLRLDPDVVMVGEIRDADTAKTAIQASITGHLVLSSFHANSSSAAFARMVDLIGVNPIFATAIRTVIAQRLVRKLADNKEPYTPDEATKNYIRQVLSDAPAEYQPDFNNLQLYRPVQSPDAPFGYSGRFCLMEQLIVNENIQKFLRGDAATVNADAIETDAKKDGMLSLLQRGIVAALKGETTLEEVNRVI